jgi:hypothetical protein
MGAGEPLVVSGVTEERLDGLFALGVSLAAVL